MKALKYGAAAIAVVSLTVIPAAPSEAVGSIWVNNHIRSVANLSVSDTNPAVSGHIYSLKPGYSGSGMQLVYGSASKATWCYLGSNYAGGHYLIKGTWNKLAYSSNYKWTCQVFNP